MEPRIRTGSRSGGSEILLFKFEYHMYLVLPLDKVWRITSFLILAEVQRAQRFLSAVGLYTSLPYLTVSYRLEQFELNFYAEFLIVFCKIRGSISY